MPNNFEKAMVTQTLNINLSKLMDPTVSISTLCTDIFLAIINIREQEDLGTPESLYKLLKHYIEMFMRNCNEMGIDSKIAESVKFALVALIDETVLSVPGQFCEFWNARSLQFEYYGEQIAGEKFYQDLHGLMVNAHYNYEILETYYYCLALGFQGKYLGRTEEREQVIRQLATILINTRQQTRSPHKKPVVTPQRSRVAFFLPTWMIITITAVIVLFMWIGTSISTRTYSQKTIRLLNDRHSVQTDQ